MEVVLDLLTVAVERAVVLVVAEGVFDLAADGEDDVGADDDAGDGDPAEGIPELEGEGEDVGPGDLADGDGVGEGQGGVDDAFGAGEDFVEGGEVGRDDAVGDAVGGEGAVGGDGVDVGGEVVQDLEGEVAEFLAVLVGALDVFPRVGFEEFEAEVAADCFPEGLVVRLREGVGVGGGAGEGGEVGHERLEVVVVGVGFEAESSFQGDGEGVDEVEGGEFGEEICFPFLWTHVVAFVGVNPDTASQIPRRLDELGPVLAAFDVALISAGSTERDTQTDDETQDCEQQVRHDELVPEL